MSVEVKNLVKIYGAQAAVNNISFVANTGEILGFLGPNGAGKSTTMKIITCYTKPTSGDVLVCGENVMAQPMKVKSLIGYLPESNPLYKDMFVREYLNFVADLHKIAHKNARIAEIVEKVGLGNEQHKLIGALSKGYKQRVGLAQALLHDPKVLILDEPTSGLDPNQIVEIRNVIKEISKDKTIIFSTHILQEVQILCDRVLIINKGNLVANTSIEEFKNRQTETNILHVTFKNAVTENDLNGISHVSRCEKVSDTEWQLFVTDMSAAQTEVFNFCVKTINSLVEMRQETRSVENVFQELTQ